MKPKTRMTKKEKLNWLADIADGLFPFDDRSIKLLRALLDDTDAQVRAEAVACLWRDAGPAWLDVLMVKAQRDPNLDVRARALSALGHYIYEKESMVYLEPYEESAILSDDDFARLVNFLFDTAHAQGASVDERRYAIEALAFLDDPEVDELIEWAYRQSDPRLRVSALFAMGRTGDLHWADLILAELHAANREVQYEAVRAAGELGLQEATEDLIRLARGRGVDKQLRLIAIYALGGTGDERAYPVLEQLCRARDREVREAARDATEEWLMVTVSEQLEAQEDDDDVWPDSAEPQDYEGEFSKDIWDNVVGTFSLN